jgi:hypothetical protein
MKIAESILTKGDVAYLSFGFVRVSGRARNVEALLNPEGEAAPNAERHEDRAEDPNSARRRRISEQKEMLKSKRQELRKVRQETSAAPASVGESRAGKEGKKDKTGATCAEKQASRREGDIPRYEPFRRRRARRSKRPERCPTSPQRKGAH